MIGLLLLETVLGAIGPQALPPAGCAAFLWSRTETPRLVAMAGTEPGLLRVQLDGKVLTLARTATEGDGVRGFAEISHYTAGPVNATLSLSAIDRPDLNDGALVREAILTVTAAGQDAIVAPLGGMIGCATGAPATRGK